jgi:hypothetical protein
LFISGKETLVKVYVVWQEIWDDGNTTTTMYGIYKDEKKASEIVTALVGNYPKSVYSPSYWVEEETVN